MTKWVLTIVITTAKVLLFHEPTKQTRGEMYETCEIMYKMGNGTQEDLLERYLSMQLRIKL